MAPTKGLIGGSAIVVGILGVLGVTNPSPDRYADFATTKGVNYLETKVCSKSLPIVGNSFQDECVRTAKSPEMKEKIRSVILQHTDRQNYLLFSLYKTDLNVHDLIPVLPGNLLPQYHAQTLGILNFFHTLSAEQDKSS